MGALFYFAKVGNVKMKSKVNPIILILLVLSVICNVFFLCNKPDEIRNEFLTYSSGIHNIELFIEKIPPVQFYDIRRGDKLFTVGELDFVNTDEGLILHTKNEIINLNELGTHACVIKQNGEVLYHFEKYEEAKKVFVTPSGKKYHYKASCAGKSAFEAPLEAAELFRDPCSICT